MAANQDTVDQMTDPYRILGRLQVNPPPFNPALNQVWERNDETGLPIFPDPIRVWQRFFPRRLLYRTAAVSDVGQEFQQGMSNNVPTFSINCRGENGKTSPKKISLLRMMLKGDFKKLEVEDRGTELFFRKTNIPLIPFSFINRYLKHLFDFDDIPYIVLGMRHFGDPDPDELMWNTYVHFNFHHSPTDRRYTILDGGFQTKIIRRFYEQIYMIQCGNFGYNQSGTGSLNCSLTCSK